MEEHVHCHLARVMAKLEELSHLVWRHWHKLHISIHVFGLGKDAFGSNGLINFHVVAQAGGRLATLAMTLCSYGTQSLYCCTYSFTRSYLVWKMWQPYLATSIETINPRHHGAIANTMGTMGTMHRNAQGSPDAVLVDIVVAVSGDMGPFVNHQTLRRRRR